MFLFAKDSFSQLDLSSCFPCSPAAFIWFFPSSSVTYIWFLNALTREEYVNLACFIILLWLEGSISSTVKYFYLSIFHNNANNANISASSMSILYCIFSSLIQSSVVMITLNILPKTFFLKRNARVVSITQKGNGFELHFLERFIVLKVNIWWMIKCNLLKLLLCLFGIFLIK